MMSTLVSIRCFVLRPTKMGIPGLSGGTSRASSPDMKLTRLLLLAGYFAATVAFGQAPSPGASDPEQTPAQSPSQNAPQSRRQDSAHRSALEVKPGAPVIKQRDLWDATGYIHPFVRMPKYIVQDQKAIWTSPAHTAKSDIKYWAIFGTATAAFVAADRHIVTQLPNSGTQLEVSRWASDFGSAYSLIPGTAAFYLLGTALHKDRTRETGLIGFEALIDANLDVEAIKLIADRARPLQANGHGGFGDGPSRWNSSFPSGHAITTWALASVVAHQYPHPRIVPIAAYAFATVVVVSRVGARQHFPGDVLAGSAMGWFIGDYVYGRRHNHELDHKPTISERILDHVELGGGGPVIVPQIPGLAGEVH